MKNSISVNILGTKISILDYPTALSIIEANIKVASNFVCVSTVHLLMETYKNNRLQKKVNKSLMITSDGVPITWVASSILKKKVHRVYGPDLMLKICNLAQKNKYKIFLLGGFNGLTKQLKINLVKKYPNLIIVGSQEAQVRPIPKRQNKLILKKIKDLHPDIIFVGLGCPIQEKWMIENYSKFKTGLFIGVGAAFDFISGRVKQAPRWIQPLGLEWLFRLLQEPKRLWRRYLYTNMHFVFAVITKYKTFYKN